MSPTVRDDADDARPSGVPVHPHVATVVIGAALGALAGVVLGVVGGPIAIVIGGVVGAVGGAGLGDILERIGELHSLREERFDADTGVIDGNLGAAPPGQRPAFVGAYSLAASGAAPTSLDEVPVEGPIPWAD